LAKPITLVCIDTVEHKLAKLAVEKCIDQFDFADVVVVSDQDWGIPGARWIHVDTHRVEDIALLTWIAPLEFSRTSHALMMQYDSWIITPHLWTDDFLRYDYIGAPWYWSKGDVGNGGFSLRTAKLAEAVIAAGLEITYPEDASLCRTHRSRLEDEFGLIWAPPDLAAQFSMENAPWPDLSWGFHGGFMVRYVLGEDYAGWLAQSTGHFLKSHSEAVRCADHYLKYPGSKLMINPWTETFGVASPSSAASG
jgi:hypothetical protein